METNLCEKNKMWTFLCILTCAAVECCTTNIVERKYANSCLFLQSFKINKEM